MSTKRLKECFFVIYDMEDNIIAYLDSFIEIKKFTKRELKKIASGYNNGYIFILNNKKYRLVAFK